MRAILMVAAVVLCGCPGDDEPDDVLDGEWGVAWSCSLGCEHREPTIAVADVVIVDGASVTWVGTAFGDIARTGERSDACIALPFDDEQTAFRGRDPFDLCADDGVLFATIREHAQAGEVQVEWTMTATR